MWRALSRYSVSRSRQVSRSLSSPPVTSSGKATGPLRLNSSPAVASRLILPNVGPPKRLFSDQSAVRSGEFEPADFSAAEAVGTSSGESDIELMEGPLDGAGSLGGAPEPEEDGDVVTEAQEVSPEQLESLVTLLQGAAGPNLEMSLDGINFPLEKKTVLKVFETQLIPGENLIKFFKWAMSSDRCKFDASPAVMGALVRAVCNGDPPKKDAYLLWDVVRELGNQAKGQSVLDVGILNELLGVFSRLGKGRAALEVLDKFAEFGFVPDAMSYYFTLGALCKRKAYDLACPVYEKMVNSGTIPGAEEVGAIISWLCNGRLAKSAHSLYSEAKKKGNLPPQSARNLLIVALCQEDETVKLAREMLDDFDDESRRSVIKPFSAVIGGLCRSKDLDGAKKLLLEMIEAGPPPGNAVFNSVINGFSKAREMETALEVKKMMESRGLKADLFTYTVIMSGFVSGGEMEEACKLLKEAKKKHKKLSPVMYHTLIRGHCKLEEFDKALGLLREMKSFGVEPNADEYNKLIQSLCLKALDTETAEKLLGEMRESGLYLNGITQGLISAVKELQGEELVAEEKRIEA